MAGSKVPDWTAELSLDYMDKLGISRAILSLSSPGVHLEGMRAAETAALAAACNDEMAEIAAARPDGFLAALPLPFAEASCEEAERCLDELNADGVALFGSTDGIFLGSSELDPLLALLNRRRALVLLHPNLHPTSTAILPEIPGYLIEFLCDTTRAALNLILSGSLQKYPDISFVLAHAGGFLPYVTWRTSHADKMPLFKERLPQGFRHYFKSLYCDSALSVSPEVMGLLKELLGPSHLLIGSDLPFAPLPVLKQELDDYRAVTAAWDQADQELINAGNFIRLHRGMEAGL